MNLTSDRVAMLRARAAEIRGSMPEPSTRLAAWPRATTAVEPRASTAVVPARPEPVTGARALELTTMYLRYYVGWPSERAADVVALWVAHALARASDGSLIWPATPRLLLTSGENGAGKSTVLDLIGFLCRSKFGRLPKVTGPAFAALMSQFGEVALLDEAKLLCGAGARSQELQGMLLAGYSAGTNALVMRGSKAVAADLFGPVAYAGRDDLLTQDGNMQLVDLIARSIVIRMARPPRHYPETGEAAREQGGMLGGAIGQWATVNCDRLTAAAARLAEEDAGTDVDPGDTGNLRRAQIWRPLLAVADVAGSDWPDRARAARDEFGGATAGGTVALDLESLATIWAGGSDGEVAWR